MRTDKNTRDSYDVDWSDKILKNKISKIQLFSDLVLVAENPNPDPYFGYLTVGVTTTPIPPSSSSTVFSPEDLG